MAFTIPSFPSMRSSRFLSRACVSAYRGDASSVSATASKSTASPPFVSATPQTLASARNFLEVAAKRVGLTSSQLSKLNSLAELVLRENKHINLTAIRTLPGVLSCHIVDALSLLQHLDSSTRSLIDVGSGAGFPGLVIGTSLPSTQVTLLDSVNKKVRFQESAISTLSLPNVRALCARAEAHCSKRARGRAAYDVAVARAVARLPLLAEMCVPMLKKGGVLLAQKSVDVQRSELKEADEALKKIGARIEKVEEAWTEELAREIAKSGDLCTGEEWECKPTEMIKAVVVVRKVSNTPQQYPRPFAVMRRNSL